MNPLSNSTAALLARHMPPGAVPEPRPAGPARLTAGEQRGLYRTRALQWHERRVPPGYRHARLPQHPATPAERAVAEWVRALAADELGRMRNSLLLTGEVGVGKTYLAYAALRAAAEAGVKDASWKGGNTGHLLDRMRPDSGESPRVVKDDLRACRILLLDDLGASKDTDFTEQVVLDLLDVREADGTFVIVTSNWPPEHLQPRIGDRAASRLMGLCAWTEVVGEDRRAVSE